MKYLGLSFLVILLLAGCTDNAKARFERFGKEANVICYSGGVKIYSGKSSGKVSNIENTNIISFVESNGKNLKEISADCIVTYER